MKNLTQFLFLCLLSAGFTSCLPDSSITTPISEGPEIEAVIPTDGSANFRVFGNDAEITNAYLQTILLPDGLTYAHHLVLTGADVLRNGDLNGNTNTPMVAASFISSATTPIGTFPLLNGRLADMGVLAAGGDVNFNFALDESTLATNFFQEGELVIEADGEGYAVSFDFKRTGNAESYLLSGTFTGRITRVQVPTEEISDEEFSGENFMRRNGADLPITNAYMVKYSSHYRLFLSDRPVHEAQELSGISNVMLFMLDGEEGNWITSGRFGLDRSSSTRTGYFNQLRGNRFARAYFCREMDFDSNTAADDEVMDTGETLVQINGGQFKIKFDFISSRNGHVEGEFQGTILDAGQ